MFHHVGVKEPKDNVFRQIVAGLAEDHEDNNFKTIII